MGPNPYICLVFFNDPATTEIYTLSLHDALPISSVSAARSAARASATSSSHDASGLAPATAHHSAVRSEEHTSELQSHSDLVCRLLLEKTNRRGPAARPDSERRPAPSRGQASTTV